MERKTKLPKSIKLYLSNKLKKKAPSLINLNNPINIPSKFRSACRYPRTPSFGTNHDDLKQTNTHDDRCEPNNAATLSDVDRFLFENFGSLYINDNDTSVTTSSSSSTSEGIGNAAAAGVGIMIVTTDPYEDFRTSMRKMVDAHHNTGASRSLDWDFMEELLIFYLQLNDKSMHKHVLRGFSDVTAGFRRSKVVSRRTVLVSRRKEMAAEREEVNDSRDRGFSMDFAEDLI